MNQQLIKAMNSPEFKELVATVQEKTAAAIEIRAKVDSYAIPLFISFDIVEGDRAGSITGEPILDPKFAYLADPHCPKFDLYIDRLHALHKKYGYEVDYGFCPALKAENEQIQAEGKLIQYAEDIGGMPTWIQLEDREMLLKCYMAAGLVV